MTQISTDGYISLGHNFSMEMSALPVPSPNTIPLIAPLWIISGQLQSASFINTLYYRVVDQPATLSKVTALIVEDNQNLADFEPTLVLIATLFMDSPDKSQPLGASIINSQVRAYTAVCF